jgi:hypothetical protein
MIRRKDTPPPRPAKQIEYQPRPRAVVVATVDTRARLVVPAPKENALRSEPYLRLVAALPCAWCGIEGYSQAAHANQGKGTGIKASDATAMPLCGPRPTSRTGGCHALLDRGGLLTKDQRREFEELWANRTRMRLRAMAAGDAGVRKIIERSIGL